MIRRTPELDELERDHARRTLARMTYEDALAIFAALWREACIVNPNFPGHWADDLEPDLAIARALNGLPPRA